MSSSKRKIAYNPTLKSRHLAAANAIAFKLRNEVALRNDLRLHFKTLGQQVKKFYNKTGKLPLFNAHEDKVNALINSHYVTVASKTSHTLRKNFKAVKNDHKVQAIIEAKIGVNADKRSDFAAGSIASTTKDDFKRYLKKTLAANEANKAKREEQRYAVIMELYKSKDKEGKGKEKGKNPARDKDFEDVEDKGEDIGEDIMRMFYEELEDRIDLIAQMETSIAADEGKSEEFDIMQKEDAEFEDGTTIAEYKQKKMWSAILDERTRPWHAEADGQIVDFDEPFIVDGEEMMEPRDDSMGASDENIMGCRCEMVEILE